MRVALATTSAPKSHTSKSLGNECRDCDKYVDCKTGSAREVESSGPEARALEVGAGVPDGARMPMLSLEALRELIERGDGSDRAFADALIRMDWARSNDSGERAKLCELQGALQAASRRSHARLREQLAEGSMGGAALRRLFDAVPPPERDHFVEEALGIAYPPLDEPGLTTDTMTYAPSGYAEIVRAIDASGLAAGDRFLDLGAGLGKVVMLAALLTGATSLGIERDQRLCQLGAQACRDIRLAGVDLRPGDAREVDDLTTEVVFMYLPFSGEVLASVMARLMANASSRGVALRQRFLCTGALEPGRYPQLTLTAPAQSWLNVYAWR